MVKEVKGKKKINLKVIFICLAVVLILGILISLGRNNDVNENTPIRLKGVSLSPKSFDAADFTQFFVKAKEAGQVISWAGDWKQMKDKSSAPYVLAELAKRHDYIPVIIIDFPEKHDEDDFIAAVSSFVKENKIQYIGIGNEINYDNLPVPHKEGILTFNRAYDAIKSKSRETTVFTIFQYEALKGMRGGLFGRVNDPSSAEWNLIEEIENADAIAFTTYPGMTYHSPAEIPENYYTEIAEHTTKPIIFTEVGWFREGPTEIEGWESSQQEQAEFIQLFNAQTGSLNTGLKIWPFLYDFDKRELFSTMGLLNRTQETSPAFEAWKNS